MITPPTALPSAVQSQATALKTYTDTLLDAQNDIISKWLGQHEIQTVFKRRSINPANFRSEFASNIFKHYMDLIQTEEISHHNEMIYSYLEFLNRKELSPDEVFTICTHFRNAWIAFAYEKNIAFLGLIDEINRLFDKNIQTILKCFHATSKKDEDRLTRERRSLLEAQRISNIGHWELDLRNDFLFWSDEVYRIFGIEPHAFAATYEAFLERVHPDDVARVNATYSDSVRDKSSYHIVYRILTVDNLLKYVETRGRHHVDEEGNVYRSVGTVHDITDKTNLQKELQLASQLFKHTNDAVLITDENNQIVIVNQTFSELTGYGIDEVKGKNPRMFSAGWGDEAFYDSMWSDIISKGVWHGEVWDRKKSGESYVAELTILNIKDDSGNTVNYIAISNDITEEKEQQKQITQLAYYDTLTKLPNRVLFRKEIDTFIHSSKFTHQKFAVFFMDLDDFKWLNDSIGHQMGNQALIEVTRRIQYILDDNTVFCRIGGDEFALFYPYEEISDVSSLAEKLIGCMQAPIPLGEKEVTLGLSIGISLYWENGRNFDTLMQAADTALYQAKENGKNHFLYFEQKMNDRVVQHLDIASQLRLALSNESFHMLYQPKVSLKDKKVYGLEALIRWEDPKLGFIPPDVFIPIAEESRIIEEIGYWVIQRSLKEFKSILSRSSKELVISINVSSKQFNDTAFVSKVSGLISASGVRPENIEFEITETAIMDNIDVIVQTLHDIKALGVSISVDDFGTGYSSMSYLKKLPINTIKIDRSFVKDIHFEVDDRAITEAIVSMGRQLNLKTIAEGVETLEHVEILSQMGVDSAQGYFYSKPISRDEFIAFIEKEQENDFIEAG